MASCVHCTRGQAARTAGQELGKHALSTRLWADDGGEADVVFLDDGGVQGVEVQQQHKAVVQPLAWFQHQATGILQKEKVAV